MAFVRAVRFTNVTPERVRDLEARVAESEGPPPGVPVKRVQIIVDEEQQTAVVLQHFDSAEDMHAAEEAFSAMDPSQTPGTRASVDRCELKAELRPSG